MFPSHFLYQIYPSNQFQEYCNSKCKNRLIDLSDSHLGLNSIKFLYTILYNTDRIYKLNLFSLPKHLIFPAPKGVSSSSLFYYLANIYYKGIGTKIDLVNAYCFYLYIWKCDSYKKRIYLSGE